MTLRLGTLSRITVAAALASGCGGGSPGPAGSASAKGAPPSGGFIDVVTPSTLFPDLVGERGVVAKEDGHRRVLIDRMRIIAREDGSLERARELLPPGS